MRLTQNNEVIEDKSKNSKKERIYDGFKCIEVSFNGIKFPDQNDFQIPKTSVITTKSSIQALDLE